MLGNRGVIAVVERAMVESNSTTYIYGGKTAAI
jgi:hypothetical protein